MQFDGVVAIHVDTEKGGSPCASSRQSVEHSGCSCCTGTHGVQIAQKTVEIPAVSLFSSTTGSRSPGSELKVPQIQFILSMLDIPVVLQRRAHSANCAEDRRDPAGACAVLGGV